jgi:hypothetical protein
VYLQGEYQQVNENAVVDADINGLGASGNNKQIAVTAGLRHRF